MEGVACAGIQYERGAAYHSPSFRKGETSAMETEVNYDLLPHREIIISDNIKGLPKIGHEEIIYPDGTADIKFLYYDKKNNVVWIDYYTWKKQRGEALGKAKKRRRRS